MAPENERVYEPLPTLRKFHESGAQIRAIVGPVGSGKTTAATWEGCYYIPDFMKKRYGINETRGVVVRNTYRELQDTTIRTILRNFPWGAGGDVKEPTDYFLNYPDGKKVEVMFRSCDRPEDVKKFKSLEITWYWIDESIEVAQEIKRMLKNRIGRFPEKCPVRFGIETTNPPDIEDLMYSDFAWDTPPPGPITNKVPLAKHAGFWQPPRENEKNLRPGYYDDLIADYRDNPDWIDTYVQGKPGALVTGKLVYNDFSRVDHVSKEHLIWARGPLWRGWDDSGNCPACVVVQMPRPMHVQIIREFHTDRMGITEFGDAVKAECNILYPGAEFVDWDDPAGHNEYSKRDGGFTSNAKLLQEECKINVQASEQNWTVRKESVEKQLRIRDGVLIDPSCIRLINGFIGGYCYPKIGNTGRFGDKPIKNKYAHVHEAGQYVFLKLLGNSDYEDSKTRQTTAQTDFDAFKHEHLRVPTVEFGFNVFGG